MVEPQWWYDFLSFLVDRGEEYHWLQKFYPIGADIFVFVYPVFLTFWYLKGILKRTQETKIEALFIFFGCLISVLINILSQQFFDKQRPIYEFAAQDGFQETLLHSFLPTTSFPSDHAVVTFSIAIATLLIGMKHQNKNLKIWSVFLFVFAIITGLCRIATTVHRTTDILAWTMVWLLVPLFLVHEKPYALLERWIITPLIRFEERVVEKIFKRKAQ